MLDQLTEGRSFSRAPAHPSGLPSAVRITPPFEYGSGYEDAYLSSPEFLITAKHIQARQTFEECEPGLGRLIFLFHLHGKRQVEVEGTGSYTLNSPTFAAFYQAEGIAKRSIWTGGDRETAVSVGFWPQRPPKVIRGPISSPSMQLTQFGDNLQPFVWMQQPLSLEMEQAARSILTPRVHHAVLEDFLETKAHELLCLGLDAVLSASELATGGASLTQSKLCKAQRILDANLKNVPSIGYLAQEVGLSTTVLSAEFSKIFNCNVSGYVVERRMMTAYHLLGSTKMPLKQVAYEVGYNHASNFSLAFKRYFGSTPRQVRRRVN